MDETAKHRGYDLWIESGRPGIHIVNQWPENAIKVVAKPELPLNQWNHLCVTYDGSGKAAGIKIFINGTNQAKDIAQDELNATIRTAKSFRIGRRFHGGSIKWSEIDEVGLYHRVLNYKEVARLSKIDPLPPLFASSLKSLPNAQRNWFMTNTSTDLTNSTNHFIRTQFQADSAQPAQKSKADLHDNG